MPTQTTLSTSAGVTVDSPKGLKAIEVFRAAYNKAGLDEDQAQQLNESPGFAAALAAAIRQFSANGLAFPVYLETEVGGKSKDKLLAEMKSASCVVSDWAQGVMSNPAWRPGEKERVKFARTTVRDIGFTKKPTTEQIWTRIRELGHSLCEPGDGPAIRLALKDQSRGDSFWVAMEQISDSDGYPVVFRVYRDDRGKSWLSALWVSPGGGWGLGCGIVFRLRK